MSNTSDVNRTRDHVEATSEPLQSSTTAFSTHGLSAPTRTSTNGADSVSWPSTYRLCSRNWTPNHGYRWDSNTPSYNCISHIKTSPYYPTTQTRPPSNGSSVSSATEASIIGTHLGAPTCRSYSINSAYNHGPPTTTGASTNEPCPCGGAPTSSSPWSWTVPSPSQPAVLTSCSRSRAITGATKAPTAGHHPCTNALPHFWSSHGPGSPG